MRGWKIQVGTGVLIGIASGLVSWGSRLSVVSSAVDPDAMVNTAYPTALLSRSKSRAEVSLDLSAKDEVTQFSSESSLLYTSQGFAPDLLEECRFVAVH